MLTPPPGPPDRSTTDHAESARHGDGCTGAAAPLPEVLLPSGGFDLGGTSTDLAWSDVLFRLQVEAIREQLAPLRSRVALASSYGREAGRSIVDGQAVRPRDVISPLQVAYALRWLELAEPAPFGPAWADLLDGPLD